ncbi:MAG: ABC transporter, partial [Candidatus Latescibacteria bacterium]|nr:ABC transporter [Candidatus Latescibacterota bacterium]
MTEYPWNGARWWKFDIHAHTPASKDYGKGENQKSYQELSPKEWLLNYMRADIDCIAITDHNTGEWIDPIKTALGELESEKPEGFRPLYVFPGVEISVNGGVHLLAILECDKTTSDIDSLLGAVGFPSTKRGSSAAVTTKTFTEVVEAIVSANGIAIPAHVDDDNGLFQLPGTTLQQVLKSKNIFAMELRDPEYPKPQLYIDKSLSWTEILGSDAHHPSGNVGQSYPGSHFTWVKMGSPSIEGLQLALLDGELSVERSDQNKGDLNEYAPLTLDAIEVSQARYMGRSQSFTIEFNPWFNAIIGGRGTGKSTVVEFLRIALRREDELPETLQSEFEQYSDVYQDREDSGLLTNEASIRVICRKDGDRFRIQWNPFGGLEPIEREVNGQWQRAEGDIRQRFPVRIYSQKQVFQLAKTPLALLKIIDEAPEVGYHAWSEKWKVEESRFLSLRAKAREIKAGLGEESRLKGELADVRRRLDIFEQSGHAKILQSFQKRSRQYREIEAWEKSWIGIGEQLCKVAAEIVPDLPDGSSFDWDSDPDKELQKHTAKTRDHLDEIRKLLEGFASQTDDIVVEWRKSKEESSWRQSVDAAMQAYRELQGNLEREGISDPAAYGELVQRQQIIEQQLKELGERKKQVDDLNNEADACLQQLLKTRRELTASRRSFLNAVLSDNQYVRIQVAPYGAREMVESEFRQILQR